MADRPGPPDEGEHLDVAVVARREGGAWRVRELPDTALDSLDDVLAELGRSGGGADLALGLLAVAEDFALVVRVEGSAEVRMLLSDLDAAREWALAQDVVDRLGEVVERPFDDPEGQEAVGDLSLLADLGLGAEALAALLEEHDLFPEDVLGEVAESLGFGPAYDDVAGLDR